MRSPSWPTTGMGPAVTPCPSATPPVGEPLLCPRPLDLWAPDRQSPDCSWT